MRGIRVRKAVTEAIPAKLAELQERFDAVAAQGPDVTARASQELQDILSGLSGLEAALPVRRAVARVASVVGPETGGSATVRAARSLNRAAGTLATSVLLDSAVEHYRGSFKNKAMYTPLVTSTLTLLISLHGTADKRPAAHYARDTTYALAALTGIVGTGFHIYNVGKRRGGFIWQNLFYGAPLGAPAAILLSGLLGVYSERVRESGKEATPKVFGLPAGRALAALTGAGLLGTTAEAALLHFRGAFHDPFMFLP